MKLNHQALSRPADWQEIGIRVPGYDVEAMRRETVRAPRWVHFGIGNIFRVFIAGIAEDLLNAGLADRGLTCVETYDFEIVDRIYTPHDCLGLSVILNADGTRDLQVVGAMAEAVKADPDDAPQRQRLKEIFTADSLQLVSFTITEKGYSLKDLDGEYLPLVRQDLEQGPERARGAMGVVTAMLLERWKKGGTPLALVSMDNCARNGKLLRASVLGMAEAWEKRGQVPAAFTEWLGCEENVAFDSTMIDKITPRPAEKIARDLEALGLEGIAPLETEKRTYIAPFVNAELPQYLVIEDRFPNGRPPLEKGRGVYLGDFDTVCLSERMKVTACLNPGHTAAGPLGVVLGQEYFAEMLRDVPAMLNLARAVIFREGIPVVESPGIIDPEAFAREVFERFSNLYLGDTNLRLATDASQGLGVRFGETIKAWIRKFGTAEPLVAIPLGIAGFFRYMMGVDDAGRPYDLAPDPLAGEIHAALAGVEIGRPETLTDQLRPYLSSLSLFPLDLYETGVAQKAEAFLREMIAGPGAARATVERYMG